MANVGNLSNLAGVEVHLCACLFLAASDLPDNWELRVTAGVRTAAQQKKLVDEGKSWTLNSRHLHGMAIDLAVIIEGKALWDFELYAEVNEKMQDAAFFLGMPLTWGGSWKQRDGVHWEIPSPDRYFD